MPAARVPGFISRVCQPRSSPMSSPIPSATANLGNESRKSMGGPCSATGKARGIIRGCYNTVLQQAYPLRHTLSIRRIPRVAPLEIAHSRVHRRPVANCARGRSKPAQPHSVRSRRATTQFRNAGDCAHARGRARQRRQFRQSALIIPTFTMANASGMATGHFLGDTGTFSNTIYTAYPVPTAGGSVTPFIENDPILGDIDGHFSGNFVDEDSILFIARRQGFSTAAIGKLGPALMFDHTERSGEETVIVDDSTGSKQGIPLSQAMQEALKAAGLPLIAPSRKDTPGDNANAGTFEKPGTLVANIAQQKYFADVTTKVVLPMF